MAVDNTKKQNILIVHNYYQIPGGEDTVVANEKKMLEDHGHKVILYTRSNTELKNMGLLRKLFLPLTTCYNPKTARDIKRIIQNEEIDIVHVHNTLNLISPAVYYAALSMDKPIVQTIHNFRLLCPGATFYRDGHICEDCVSKGLTCALKHKCYRESFFQTLVCVINTKIHRLTGIYGKINYICLTEFNKKKLLSLKHVRPERVFVKPNFVRKEPLSNNKREFYVFVGRLEEIKGVRELIKVWQCLGKDAPILKMCGNGPLLDECSEYVKNNHIENIQVLGFVKHEEVKDIISRSRYLILPTKVYEGFPMTIIEAFSQATPVIVPNMGNAGNLVQEGVNGYKYDFDSLDSFAECIKRSIASPNLEISTIEEFRNKYTDTINSEMIEKIYEKVGGGVITIVEYSRILTANERENQFVFAGRLDKLKGIDLLLQAWKELGKKAPKLIVCGTGPLEDWCISFVTENKCNVELRGFVPNEEAKKLIAKSKGLILPTQWYEGFPMTILEAFSVGTPVLCSDLGNAGSVVDEGVTGYKFQFDSIDGIVEAANRSAVKSLDYEEINKLYLEKYSGEVNYKMLKEIYDNVQMKLY